MTLKGSNSILVNVESFKIPYFQKQWQVHEVKRLNYTITASAWVESCERFSKFNWEKKFCKSKLE